MSVQRAPRLSKVRGIAPVCLQGAGGIAVPLLDKEGDRGRLMALIPKIIFPAPPLLNQGGELYSYTSAVPLIGEPRGFPKFEESSRSRQVL